VTDLESRLRDALRASVATVEPTFTAADVMRRHDGRVRRVAATCLTVGMTMAVLAIFLPRQFGRVEAAAMTYEPLAGHTTSYVDPVYGWTISYNRALVEGRSASGSEPHVVEAVRFTNFKPDLNASGHGELRMSWLREFPASGVALQVWVVAGKRTYREAHVTAFPLQVTTFAPVQRFAGGSEPVPLFREFSGDGHQVKAAVWIGRLASTASTQAIWAAVRSVRFPPQEPGRRRERPDREYAAPDPTRYGKSDWSRNLRS
jgi:hypothetical protein